MGSHATALPANSCGNNHVADTIVIAVSVWRRVQTGDAVVATAFDPTESKRALNI